MTAVVPDQTPLRTRHWLVDVVAFLRVPDWYYLVGLGLLGYTYRMPRLDVANLGLVLAVTSLYLAHGYGFNHYYDVRAGEREPTSARVARSGLLLSIACLIGAIGLALLCLPPIVAALLGVGGVISLLYSSSLTRLKRLPFWNVVLNSSGFTVLFLVGFFANKTYLPVVPCLLGYIWLGIVPFQVIHLMSHRPQEGYWSLSQRASLVLFYLSQALWVGFGAIVSLLYYRGMVVLTALTTVYCLVQVLVVLREKRGAQLTVEAATQTRHWLKLMNIAFGVLLVVLFVLT
jgi:4-hydroxybenzoate polyprenyltransferase